MDEELFYSPSPSGDIQVDDSDDTQKTPTQQITTLPSIPFEGISQPSHHPNVMPDSTCLGLPSISSVQMEQQPDIQAKFLHILSRPPRKLHLSVCHIFTREQSQTFG